MRRQLILFIIGVTILTHSYSQKIGDYYVTVDSLRSLQFRLLTDSTIEFSIVWRHMSPPRKAVYKYYSSDTTIEVLPNQFLEKDILLKGVLINFLNIKEKRSLIKIEGGFIDNNQSVIYVRQKDFGKNPDLAYIIDGKTYFQDIEKKDGYGLLRKKPKPNIQLRRKLKYITKDNCNIEIVKAGLNTYLRLGLKYVYGAIIITTIK